MSGYDGFEDDEDERPPDRWCQDCKATIADGEPYHTLTMVGHYEPGMIEAVREHLAERGYDADILGEPIVAVLCLGCAARHSRSFIHGIVTRGGALGPRG